MARFTGYRCDNCDKSGDASDKGQLPEGWMQVVLPLATEEVRPEDRSRDICCGKCLAEFGRARGEVDGSIKVKVKSEMDPGLKAFLESEGITGRMIGTTMGSHAKSNHHVSNPVEGCLVCTYYAAGAPVGVSR